LTFLFFLSSRDGLISSLTSLITLGLSFFFPSGCSLMSLSYFCIKVLLNTSIVLLLFFNGCQLLSLECCDILLGVLPFPVLRLDKQVILVSAFLNPRDSQIKVVIDYFPHFIFLFVISSDHLLICFRLRGMVLALMVNVSVKEP